MTTPQHEDPFGDATGKVLQALAVLTTVGESVARFAAAGAHSRATKAERQANLERAADAARQQADRAAQQGQRRADRLFMDLAFDSGWLAKADIEAVAKLWRTAAMHGLSGDRRAAEAMRRAEQRLATLNPGLIDAYHRHRGDGQPIADAMNAAAQEVWQHQTRPSSSSATTPGTASDPTPSATLPDPTGQKTVQPVDQLDAATQAEIRRLAHDVDPDVLSQLERQWRGTGKIPAADAAARLVAVVRKTRADAELGGQTPAAPHAGQVQDRLADPEASAEPTPSSQPAPAGRDDVRAGLAEQEHHTRQGDQQLRQAAIDQGQPDLPATAADEHRDGQTTGHARRGQAEHDLAGAAQLRRFGQAFPPLTSLTPTFSHAPTSRSSQPTTPRRGSTR